MLVISFVNHMIRNIVSKKKMTHTNGMCSEA